MEQHIYVSLRLETLSRALEGTLVFWVRWELTLLEDGSRRYRLFHEVSPAETWNCGEITLAQLRTIPGVLKPLLPNAEPTPELLSEWTDLVITLPDDASRDEHNHLQIALGGFLDNIPGNTFRRATGDRIVAFASPSLETLLTSPPTLVSPRTGIQLFPQVFEIPTPVSEAADRGDAPLAQEGPPSIPPHPLKVRRERVRDLYLQGSAYKDIAREIDESLHLVKKDLEWLRKRNLLPPR